MSQILRPEQRRPLMPCCTKDGTNDPDVERLWDLMNQGMSQREASLLIWGDADA